MAPVYTQYNAELANHSNFEHSYNSCDQREYKTHIHSNPNILTCYNCMNSLKKDYFVECSSCSKSFCVICQLHYNNELCVCGTRLNDVSKGRVDQAVHSWRMFCTNNEDLVRSWKTYLTLSEFSSIIDLVCI